MKKMAFIPCRRNSKGIPFKNRKKIGGLSIVEHAVSFAKSSCFDEIVISTDDEFFLQHNDLGKLCVSRPRELGSDTAIIADVMIDFVMSLSERTFIVVLEPTAFPRASNDLDQILTGKVKSDFNFASFSKTPVLREKIWNFNEQPFVQKSVWKRRQEYDCQHVLTGHYYGFWSDKVEDYYPGLVSTDHLTPFFIDYPILILMMRKI